MAGPTKRRKSRAMDLSDRLPPHSTENEQGLIGCLVHPTNDVMSIIRSRRFTAEMLFEIRHQEIFKAYEELIDENPGRIVDLVMISDRLKDKEQLESIGGVAYLSACADVIPSASNVEYYIDALHEKYLLRRSIQVCTEAAQMAHEALTPSAVQSFLDTLEKDVLAIRLQSTEQLTTKQIASNAVLHMQAMFEKDGILGLSTGYKDIDRDTEGMQKGDMIVISGYPSTGKTSLAMNIAEHVAIEQKMPVGVFSLEMSAERLMLRMFASQARVNLRKCRETSDRDFPKLVASTKRVSNAPFKIWDDADTTVIQMRAIARRWKLEDPDLALIVIDYLQLLSAPDVKEKENREQEVSFIGKQIKAMAKELKIPVIVLSQLNDDGKLRESRATGQHADGLWKLILDGEQAGELCAVKVNLVIEKQRDGIAGSIIPLTFLKACTRYENYSKIGEE